MTLDKAASRQYGNEPRDVEYHVGDLVRVDERVTYTGSPVAGEIGTVTRVYVQSIPELAHEYDVRCENGYGARLYYGEVLPHAR